MFPEEARQIYNHLTEAHYQLELIRDDYPEQGWVLHYLQEDIRVTRDRINEMLQS